MPSGPPELHEFWCNYYTDWPDERMAGSGDLAACRYLNEQGFTLTRRWDWIHPAYHDINEVSDLEYDAISYLIMEWDYGGFRKADSSEFTGN